MLSSTVQTPLGDKSLYILLSALPALSAAISTVP